MVIPPNQLHSRAAFRINAMTNFSIGMTRQGQLVQQLVDDE